MSIVERLKNIVWVDEDAIQNTCRENSIATSDLCGMYIIQNRKEASMFIKRETEYFKVKLWNKNKNTIFNSCSFTNKCKLSLTVETIRNS